MSSPTLLLSPLTETLERLQANSNLSSTEWFDLVGINYSDYLEIKMNYRALPEKSIENLSKYFNLDPEQIVNGTINFKDLTLKMEKGSKELPEIYSRAAFGRQRTSITSLDFVEYVGGWRLRNDVTKKLGVPESALLDPFAPISMNFISDLCSYLALRQFKSHDFYYMGAYAFVSNKDSVIGKILSEMPNARTAYDFFFNDCLKLLERNCKYQLTQITQNALTLEYVTNLDVAAESGVRHLGNQHVCQLKTGFIATIPQYLGLPPAHITKTSCVHNGDPVCTMQIDITETNKAQLKRNS